MLKAYESTNAVADWTCISDPERRAEEPLASEAVILGKLVEEFCSNGLIDSRVKSIVWDVVLKMIESCHGIKLIRFEEVG